MLQWSVLPTNFCHGNNCLNTYISKSSDEALFIVHIELGTILIAFPEVDIVQKGSEPGLGVQRIDVGGVLQLLQQILHVFLNLWITVVKGAAYYHLEKKHVK